MRYLALICIFAFGCAYGDQKLKADVYYQKDISMTINGQEFSGVAVPKKAPEYRIEITAAGKINMLTITTCHKELKFEEPTDGWFKSKTFTYVFKPVSGIEDQSGCMLDIGAYEKSKGRHSWGLIDFETSEQDVPAILKCNGSDRQYRGSSICQAKAGLTQKIIFMEQVKVVPDSEECSVMASDDRKTFTYTMPVGECTYFFVMKSGRSHRHTTYGYESILIRGD